MPVCPGAAQPQVRRCRAACVLDTRGDETPIIPLQGSKYLLFWDSLEIAACKTATAPCVSRSQ